MSHEAPCEVIENEVRFLTQSTRLGLYSKVQCDPFCGRASEGLTLDGAFWPENDGHWVLLLFLFLMQLMHPPPGADIGCADNSSGGAPAFGVPPLLDSPHSG